MKNKKKILFSLLLIFLMSLFFILPTAQAQNGVVLPENTGLAESTVADILTKLLNWLLEMVGIIAIIGFVISGIMYLVSAGNEEMITKAKKYMMYCLIGIIVALASFVVIKTIDSILNAGGSSSSSSYSSSSSSWLTSPSGGGQYDPKDTTPSGSSSSGGGQFDPKASEKSTEPFVNTSGVDADIVPF